MMRRTVERRSLPGWRSKTAPAAWAPQSLSSRRRSPIRCSAPGPKGENLERTTREAFSPTLGDESGRGNGRGPTQETMSTWRAKQTVASQDKPTAMADWLPRPRTFFSGSSGIP